MVEEKILKQLPPNSGSGVKDLSVFETRRNNEPQVVIDLLIGQTTSQGVYIKELTDEVARLTTLLKENKIDPGQMPKSKSQNKKKK